MADQLVDFFRARKVQAPHPALDWPAKRDAWIEAVESLYAFIKEMLRDSIASKDITVRTVDLEVTEDFIGSYSIPALELTVGDERVEFRPKGVTVIGAAGRVDIVGDRDTVTLLWNNKDASSGWTVIARRVPQLVTAALDAETLTYALDRVMLPLP